MEITLKNEQWLKKFYPQLNITQTSTGKIVEGIFKFRAAYDKKKKKYIIEPTAKDYQDYEVIEDDYEIKITFNKDGNFFREVQELGGKIKETARLKGIADLSDLHFHNDSNKGCIVGYFDENLNISFQEFIDCPVLQFFYDQSYFRLHGKWPRSFYPHGILGMLENIYFKEMKNSLPETNKILIELRAMKEKDPLGYAKLTEYCNKKKNNKGWHCLNKKQCHGKRMVDCHTNSFKGLVTLKRLLKKNKIKL